MVNRAELAEDTAVHLLHRPSFDMVERPGFVYEAGAHRGAVHRIRLGDVEAAVEWTRAESARRGHRTLEWWIGWSATPPDLPQQLEALGLEPDDPPSLLGLTSTVAPPAAPGIEVRPIHTLDEQLAALEVDWEVWELTPDERAQRDEWERERFDAIEASGVVHHFAAFLDGRIVGFARAIDMRDSVGLFGGTVLRDARGRGAYRALVRARWEHAAARGTPLLVVQAGPMSAPVLAGLGFEEHGAVRLFRDPHV